MSAYDQPPAAAIDLSADPCRLVLATQGGAVLRFDIAETPVFRPASAATAPFPFANFPLVPFSNRIAGGRFPWHGAEWQVPRTLPLPEFPVPIHGFGWTSEWTVNDRDGSSATLTLDYLGDGWPGPFRATQRFLVREDGYDHFVAMTNMGQGPIPAGIGLHPYFPAGATAIETGFDGEWVTPDDGIPTGWAPLDRQPDWFGGAAIDRGFTGRSGAIRLVWPDRAVTIDADPVFSETQIYIPPGRDHFCVEPVSHRTDAANSREGVAILAPGATLSGRVGFTVTPR